MCRRNVADLRSSPPARVRKAMELLLDAFDYSCDLRVPLSEFALSVHSLRRHEVADIDIRWLISRGFVEYLGDDAFPQPGTLLPNLLQIVLSKPGVLYAQQLLEQEQRSVQDREVPEWDPLQRELRFANQLIKRFRVPAPNQECVLGAFQEDVWPLRIDDPIPPSHSIDPRRRLHDTIVALNRGQVRDGIRFRGDGTGTGICWHCDSTGLSRQ